MSILNLGAFLKKKASVDFLDWEHVGPKVVLGALANVYFSTTWTLRLINLVLSTFIQ
jgi:hypothetical protein